MNTNFEEKFENGRKEKRIGVKHQKIVEEKLKSKLEKKKLLKMTRDTNLKSLIRSFENKFKNKFFSVSKKNLFL